MDYVLMGARLDMEEEEEEEERRLLTAFVLTGIEENQKHKSEIRNKTRLYLTRPDLLPDPCNDTPWTTLYNRREPRAFITTMGFNPDSFDYILRPFQLIWDTTTIPRADVSSRGKPRLLSRSLDAAGALGLTLHYLNSTMDNTTLAQIFALIPMTISQYLDFSIFILEKTLSKLPEGKIHYPEALDVHESYAKNVQDRHPLLEKIFGSLDGLKVPVAVSDDPEIENQNYNGWLHDHFVSCIFLFSLTGHC